MSERLLRILSVLLPIIITALIPSSFAPGFLSRALLFGLVFWLARDIRLTTREFLLVRRARALGARLAPRVHSTLPFGLSYLRQRIATFKNGTPRGAAEVFKSFPAGTKTIRVRTLGVESLITISHLDTKYILSTAFANWGKSQTFLDSFKPLLGDGVFNSDQRGLWSWHRSLIRPHFSREKIADVNACAKHVTRVVSWLKTQYHPESGEPLELDIQDVFMRFALAVSSEHLFGQCVDTLNELFCDQPTPPDSINATQFSEDFAAAQLQCLILFQTSSVVRRLFRLFKRSNKSLKGVFKVIDALVGKAEEEGKEYISEENDRLIQHLRRAGASTELIKFATLNVLLASRESTASLLTSCIYELAGRDDIWKRLQAEMEGLPEDENILPEHLPKLKFLRAVINETLRLHPPIWINERGAIEDDVLPSGIFVPAGTGCRFIIREFQRDPDVWGKDAEEFVPDRWLDDRQAAQSKDPFRFQPFSAGPRLCVGQQLSYTQASMTLARIVMAFSGVELAGPSSSREMVKELPSVTLSVRGGLWVKFRK